MSVNKEGPNPVAHSQNIIGKQEFECENRIKFSQVNFLKISFPIDSPEIYCNCIRHCQ